MKKIIPIVFLLFPLAAFAQLSAVNPDASKSTRWLTGKQESVYVFFDNKTMQLQARHSSGESSTFTWKRLDVAGKQLVDIQTVNNVTSSTLTVPMEGGYQVHIENPASAIDTFTTWIFRDTFRINTVTHAIDCEALRLETEMTPTMNARYTMFNFPSVLAVPFVAARDSSYLNQSMKVQWTPSVNIHEGVDNPDESWKIRAYTYIDNPPPMKSATYKIDIIDVFGKHVSYTTPSEIKAIAAYAKITATDNQGNRFEQSGSDPTAQPKGEALYRISFSQNQSLNGEQFDWKGFFSNTVRNGEQTIMWSKTTQNANDSIYPQVPYKGGTLDGYTPGNYKVRLIVHNLQSGCADSTDIKYIEVEPSKFDKESLPNAFTPNNDGQNDFFIFVKGKEPVSLEYVNIYVYNRSGHLVYKYEGRSDAWKGWNGKMMGTGSDVADGVYFYVVNGEGWDGVMYNSSQYKGNVTIFR